MSAVAVEEESIREILNTVELVESVSRDLPLVESDKRSRLETAVKRMLGQIRPIRVEIAARLLGVSDKTVRAWTKAGLLLVAQESPRLLLDPLRLHEVVHLAGDLRAAGRKNRELLDLIWYRLHDEVLLEEADLQESLAQMAGRQGRLLNAGQVAESTKER